MKENMKDAKKRCSLKKYLKDYLKDNWKKAICTGIAMSMIVVANPMVQAATYQVKSGDTLFLIAQRNGVTVDQIKISNALTSDMLFVGNTLIIPEPYTVKAGDTIFLLAQRYETTMNTIIKLNNLASDRLDIGQTLLLPIKGQGIVSLETSNFTGRYTVTSGDSLWIIALRFETTVDRLITENKLKSHHIWVGQSLLVPAKVSTVASSSLANTSNNVTTNVISNNSTASNTSTVTNTTNNTQQNQLPQEAPRITYHDYIVKSGDTGWSIAINHGMPFHEFMKLNNFNQNTMFFVGQRVKIAKYNIPINNPVQLNRGAYMDWWTGAQYVFPINAVAKVTDLQTGLSWYTKRTIGANHADCEPLTAQDAQIMLRVWGGQWSWQTRPILVEINGHRLAASASAMPHDIQYINNNNFNGHFDIYFGNSTRHVDGKPDANHERNVRIAAGLN